MFRPCPTPSTLEYSPLVLETHMQVTLRRKWISLLLVGWAGILVACQQDLVAPKVAGAPKRLVLKPQVPEMAAVNAYVCGTVAYTGAPAKSGYTGQRITLEGKGRPSKG